MKRSILRMIILLLSVSGFAHSQSDDVPEANPARPTVSNPATLTPVGYLQFETGYLGGWHSPEFSAQSSFNEVAKIAVASRIQLLASWEPFARSHVDNQWSNAAGGVSLGVQGLVHRGEGSHPSIALNYFRSVYDGNTPDIDIGSAQNSLTVLASADVKGFHYDTNFLLNEVKGDGVRRAQFGETLSISHPLVGKMGLTGEIWTFSQPLLRGRTVGNLWALNYNARKNLVLDAGFNRGLTSTATRWELFTGFTYLLPHKISFH
jgi:hypothetical protein